jgi:hypothetical protein
MCRFGGVAPAIRNPAIAAAHWAAICEAFSDSALTRL